MTDYELELIVQLVKYLKKYGPDHLDESSILFLEEIYSELNITH